MASASFRFTNKYSETILIVEEPEGTIRELEPGDSLHIELLNGAPALDIQIGRFENHICLCLWSESGGYVIKGA